MGEVHLYFSVTSRCVTGDVCCQAEVEQERDYAQAEVAKHQSRLESLMKEATELKEQLSKPQEPQIVEVVKEVIKEVQVEVVKEVKVEVEAPKPETTEEEVTRVVCLCYCFCLCQSSNHIAFYFESFKMNPGHLESFH